MNGGLLPGTRIEILNPQVQRGRVRFALFDWDGTVSLIREGWQQVMIPMMVEELLKLRTGESREALEHLVAEFVTKLTGKQTIYQMIALAEQVSLRGGNPQDPVDYKRRYHDLLWARIKHRVAGLKDGSIEPDQLAILGSRQFLSALRERGVSLFLASGTDEAYVKDEVAALRMTEFFDGGIYGAIDDYKKMSKKLVIERILKENDLHGPELVAFGDGYVEIRDCKAVGGVAVGLATLETERGGLDHWKRDRLAGVGADIIIPDFQEGELLLDYLLEDASPTV
ncbi:MAG TPA: HAD family hydrolase [Armatimonadota bacterium]|jgi:phosphoglycolate phosphatase-like HAD superfamily hydrolase